MSRGPGRLQQAIIRAFNATPSAVFCAKEIVEIGFPIVQHQVKHRVAALRAARTLAEISPRFETYIGAPSAGGLIIVNATNRRSLGIGKVFEKFVGARTVADCVAFLDDPSSEAYPEAQPDGFFDLLACRNALWAEWRDDEAEILSARIQERVAKANRTPEITMKQQQQGAPA